MNKSLILDGRATREALMPELVERIKSLSAEGISPTLAIIQVGDRPDSTAFIRAKKSFAAKLGISVKHFQLLETTSQTEVVDLVKKCNADATIHGIIVQLPLPIALDRDAVIESIDPRKDADALTATNVKKWMEGKEDSIMPATARGIRTLLNHNEIELFGKKVCVIGRSMLVGKPITAMCLNENATVTVCHSNTANLASETQEAEVLIVAAGKPQFIGPDHVKAGQIVIDIGINTVAGEKLDDEIDGTRLVGDVDFDRVSPIVSAITPVPGGVGPMTVYSLFENLIDLCENHLH